MHSSPGQVYTYSESISILWFHFFPFPSNSIGRPVYHNMLHVKLKHASLAQNSSSCDSFVKLYKPVRSKELVEVVSPQSPGLH